MITKSTGYQSSDGTFHPTLEEAQGHELRALFIEAEKVTTPQIEWDSDSVSGYIMNRRDKIIDILTMKPNSLPKARKINGGTKKREKKHIAEQFAMPLGETPAKATA